jgi:coenzyme Q-binding protein COQ10
MPLFSTSRIVGVPFDVAYVVASDVASYKSFLPLLEQSVIRGAVTESGDVRSFNAELTVGYAKLGLRESFVSHVVCDRAKGTVMATSRDAPFKDMKTVWTIRDLDGQCDVSISVEYAMRNMLIQMAVGGAMDMAVRKVMSAFEARAKAIYSASRTS